MGSASIVSDLGGGQYSVSLTLERARITAAISALTVRIAQLTDKILTMDAGIDKDIATLQKAALAKRKSVFGNAPADPTLSAWCADLTLALTGNVGTIEIPGERGSVQIQPGYASNAVYSAARDGQLQATIASTPAGVFYNWAMLPGWQKFKPTFRLGVLSALDEDNDLCTVTLDSVKSSAQGLGINQATVLSSVPIDYMDCNAIAFENGDRVVVEFEGQDWNAPKVIGFETNPRPCLPGENFVLVRCDMTDREGPHGSVREHWYYYFVWDIKRNDYAWIDDGEDGLVEFPCELSEIQGWLDASDEAGVDLFDRSYQGEQSNLSITGDQEAIWPPQADPCTELPFDYEAFYDANPGSDPRSYPPYYTETGEVLQDYVHFWGVAVADCEWGHPNYATWTHLPFESNKLTIIEVYAPKYGTGYTGGVSGLTSWQEVSGDEEEIDPPAWSVWAPVVPKSHELKIENLVGGYTALRVQKSDEVYWATTDYGDSGEVAYETRSVKTTWKVYCPLGLVGEYDNTYYAHYSFAVDPIEAIATYEVPSFVRLRARGVYNSVALAQLHCSDFGKETCTRPCSQNTNSQMWVPYEGTHQWGEVVVGAREVDIVASCRECDGTTADPRTESRNTAFENALKAIYQYVVDTGLGNGFPLLDVYLYTHVEA